MKETAHETHLIPLAYSVERLAEASGFSRSLIYQEIAAGRLKAKKLGRRTAILKDDALAWLSALPSI